jgi:hypothetical protein
MTNGAPNGDSQEAPSRKRAAGQFPTFDEEVDCDDFVVVERADLMHGYASSTNLEQQGLQWDSKRQCLYGPKSREGSTEGFQSDLEVGRCGIPIVPHNL